MGKKVQGAKLRAKKRQRELRDTLQEAQAQQAAVQQSVVDQWQQIIEDKTPDALEAAQAVQLFVIDTKGTGGQALPNSKKKSRTAIKASDNKNNKTRRDATSLRNAKLQAQLDKLVKKHTPQELKAMAAKGREQLDQPLKLRGMRQARAKRVFGLWGNDEDSDNNNKNNNTTAQTTTTPKATEEESNNDDNDDKTATSPPAKLNISQCISGVKVPLVSATHPRGFPKKPMGKRYVPKALLQPLPPKKMADDDDEKEKVEEEAVAAATTTIDTDKEDSAATTTKKKKKKKKKKTTGPASADEEESSTPTPRATLPTLVPMADEGQSYRPDPQAHAASLHHAVQLETERNKVIEYHETPVSAGLQPETRALLLGDSSDEEDNADQDDDDEADDGATTATMTNYFHKQRDKLTRTEKNRRKRIRLFQKAERDAKNKRKFENTVHQVGLYLKEMKAEDDARTKRQKQVADVKEAALQYNLQHPNRAIETTMALRVNPEEAPAHPVALPSEIKAPGASLRTMIPKGNLVTDRMATYAFGPRHAKMKLNPLGKASFATVGRRAPRIKSKKRVKGVKEWQGPGYNIVAS